MTEILSEWNERLVPWIVSHGLKILVIIIAAYILNLISRRFIEKAVRVAIVPDKDFSPDSEKKREDTLIRIFSWTVSLILFLIASLMVLDETGVPIGPMLAGAGIAGIAIGFGGQYLIRDIITGFFIILENQYRIGDSVQFDQTSGLVEDISLRITTLRDLDGTVHHIPHGEIKRVSNLSKNFSRINIDVGISYQSDLDKVIEVVNRTGMELADTPPWKEYIIKPPQFLRINEFGEYAMMIKILGETWPMKQWEVTGELRKRLKFAFDEAGIEMPYTQRITQHVK